MRVAMMVAGAVAAAGASVPAEAAVTGTLLTGTGSRLNFSGYMEVCTSYYVPSTCVYSAPTYISYNPSFTVPDLNGTYSFTDTIGSGTNSGVYMASGSLTFENGRLISDFYDFTYNATQVNNTTGSLFINTFSGRIVNASALVTVAGVPTLMVPVPEPTTWAMMVMGFATLGIALRQRQATQRVSAARG